MSSAAKSHPAPRTLERVLSESQLLPVHNNGCTPTLVLCLSPKCLPGNDMLAAMSTIWTDSATINVGAMPMMPFSAPSIMVRPFHGSASRRCLPPALLRSRLRDRPGVANAPTLARLSVHPLSLRNDTFSPDVFPRRFPPRPRPIPRLEKPSDGSQPNMGLREPTIARRPNLRLSPRQRSTRTHPNVGYSPSAESYRRVVQLPYASQGPTTRLSERDECSRCAEWRHDRALKKITGTKRGT